MERHKSFDQSRWEYAGALDTYEKAKREWLAVIKYWLLMKTTFAHAIGALDDPEFKPEPITQSGQTDVLLHKEIGDPLDSRRHYVVLKLNSRLYYLTVHMPHETNRPSYSYGIGQELSDEEYLEFGVEFVSRLEEAISKKEAANV